MFSRRPVQYAGLLLLVLTSLAVIFFPVGPPPKEQSYTVHLKAPKKFAELVAKKKDPVKEAENAFLTKFVSDRLPGALEISADGFTATVKDNVTSRDDAQDRSKRIVESLSLLFKGVQSTKQTEAEIAAIPMKPLFTVGLYSVYPCRAPGGTPKPAVKLGLDLQGGVYLVLQIRRALFTYQLDKPLPAGVEERDQLVLAVREALQKTSPDAGLARADVVVQPGSDTLIEVRTQAADRKVFALQTKTIAEQLKTVSGHVFTPLGEPKFFDPQEDASGQANGASQQEILNQTQRIIESRVDSLGVSEPIIQQQLPDRIIVQLPGVSDPQRAVEVVGKTAQMQIRLLDENVKHEQDRNDPNLTRFFDDKGAEIKGSDMVDPVRGLQYSKIIVSGSDLKPVTRAGFLQGQEAAVFFELQPAAAGKFGEVTAANVQRYMPIFLDDRCISAPVIQSAITGGSGQISGGFETIKEAQDLALMLNSGALPAPLDVVENRTVSATLGQESLGQSLLAGLYGIIAVMIFMIAYYRLPGALANCALAIYLLLNMAAFILIGATLTLPGIAGFLLALAMSLDTNILVFERLKEEMAVQPTFAAALRAAFARAWTAILDSHVTTFIAAGVLFYLGTGPVKGFALTLAIGVLLSLFSAISVTRLFMWSVARTGETNRGMFANAVQSTAALAAQKQ